jgi:hypothetical protein
VTTLTVGGIFGTFTSTTVAADTTPDGFDFLSLSGVARNVTVVSNTITLAGINADTPMSIANGEYSVGCNGTFSSAAGTVLNGQSICVRHTSSAQASTTVTTTLTVGGVSANFASATAASSGGGSSSGGGGGALDLPLLLVLGLLASSSLWQRRRASLTISSN